MHPLEERKILLEFIEKHPEGVTKAQCAEYLKEQGADEWPLHQKLLKLAIPAKIGCEGWGEDDLWRPTFWSHPQCRVPMGWNTHGYGGQQLD